MPLDYEKMMQDYILQEKNFNFLAVMHSLFLLIVGLLGTLLAYCYLEETKIIIPTFLAIGVVISPFPLKDFITHKNNISKFTGLLAVYIELKKEYIELKKELQNLEKSKMKESEKSRYVMLKRILKRLKRILKRLKL